MIVVSDTGPLRYLIEVDAVNTLPQLYKNIKTTPQVVRELRFAHFPDAVRQWAGNPPGWLSVESPSAVHFLDRLGEGEASAISLASECKAALVLIDERIAAGIARSVGLKSVGTLAVLQEAGYEGLLDFHATIQRLVTQTRFRHSKKLITQITAEYDRNKKSRP